MESAANITIDALLALQPTGSAAITASTLSSAVNLYEITASPYGALNGRNGIGTFDLGMYISAADFTSGNEAYSFQVQTVANDGVTVTTQETITVTAAQIGLYLAYPFQPKTLAAFAAGDAAYLRLNAVLAGTTPSLTYWAYLTDHHNA